MKKFLPILTALVLAGCVGLPSGEAYNDRLEQLSNIALPDLESANRLAIAADDKAAMQCWPAVIEFAKHLDEYRQSIGEAAPGVFTSYQRLRNIRRRLSDGIPEDVHLACAAMVSESRSAIVNLLLRVH